MKGEEKNVLMKVVWFSLKCPAINRYVANELPHTVYFSVRKPIVIKVEKTAENKWELKIALDFDGGYPGQNLLLIAEDYVTPSVFGGRYPGPSRHFFGSYRCLQSNLLKDLLKLRQYLKVAKTVEQAEGLLKKLIKPVYWEWRRGFSYSFDTSCKALPKNVKLPQIGLSRGTAKKTLELVGWQNYRISLEQLAIKDNLFLEKLQYSYSGEYANVQLPLFSSSVRAHLLGFCMLPSREFMQEAQGIYSGNDRYEEAGIINATYYTSADGDEFRKVADWLQMAGIERKKNGNRRKRTLEEECLFRWKFLLQLEYNKA